MDTITGIGSVNYSRIVTDKFGNRSLRYGVRVVKGDDVIQVWFKFGGKSFDQAVAYREANKCYAGAVVNFHDAEIVNAKHSVYKGAVQLEVEARRPAIWQTVEESDYTPTEKTVTQFV